MFQIGYEVHYMCVIGCLTDFCQKNNFGFFKAKIINFALKKTK